MALQAAVVARDAFRRTRPRRMPPRTAAAAAVRTVQGRREEVAAEGGDSLALLGARLGPRGRCGPRLAGDVAEGAGPPSEPISSE